MITAIYARKSTEQNGIADEQKSVTRQIEHARSYAARKGWTVADEHVYVDDGISGAEFATRPGFLRLMNALKQRPPFQILVMSEESRLGREAIETAYALKQLVTAGVRVFFYLEDRERTLDSPTDKIMLSLTTFADELEREKARQRTYDAMLRKARAGHVTGGRVFGYDNVRMDTGGVRRVINEAEAVVVRRIFEMAAGGSGLTAIAKSLNADRVASPRAQQGRPNGWAPSSVREVLNRSLHRGEMVWNQSRKRDRWGVKRQHPRPDAEWIRVPVPELAIVSDALWTGAHARMDQQRKRYDRTRRTGAPPWSIEAKYLLTGLLRCGIFGGGLEARSRSHGRERVFFYGCASYHRRGCSVCGNALTVRMDCADEEILRALKTHLLNPHVLKAALSRAADLLARPAQQQIARDRDMAKIDQELSRLTAAIAEGGELAVLVAAIRAREDRRAALLRTVPTPVHTIDRKAVLEDLQKRLSDWRSLLRDETPKARRLVKQLIRGRLEMTPIPGRGVYRYEGIGTLEPLLSGIVPAVPQCGSSPTGFERVYFEGPLAA